MGWPTSRSRSSRPDRGPIHLVVERIARVLRFVPEVDGIGVLAFEPLGGAGSAAMLVGELRPGEDHDRDRVAFVREPVEAGTDELEATARHPAGARAAGRERRGDRRREELVPFVREQPFRHVVAGAERMGDPVDGQGPLDRPRGEPDLAAPGLRAAREVEDLDT